MEFDSIFGSDDNFDTVFGGSEDGSLIDMCCGVNESEINIDFDDLHHEDDYNADPSDFEDELGPGHDSNAPRGAEGTDGDPAINLAMGEAGSEFSCVGKKGMSDADRFYAGYDAEVPSSLPGEGPDVNMDPEDTDGEFDKMVSSAVDKVGTKTVDMNHEGVEDYFGDSIEYKFGINESDESDEEDSSSDEEFEEMCNRSSRGRAFFESDEYEEGDSDLVDLVSSGGEY